ncbi:glycoside hydrolase domain-containing protein [Brevibacillus sp. SYSU BS000544]|uniref:glycoside hydrolase domain-containing protein n=1 Tax=Brevibacillus sp. SYSU BS000544 TaxID=3416443 RepID=UPI003CE517F7
MVAALWGVDSAARVTETIYECVRRNYGVPAYWGRYLTTVPGAADGLTTNEISFLHRKGIKILPVYSAFRRAVGFANGQIVARNTLFHARRLRIPRGTVIFANVERFFEVDEGWIRGWVNTFLPSGYRPGIYHDPVTGNFNAAFCAAAARDPMVSRRAILWSAEPDPGVTSKQKAPPFAPTKVNCPANVLIWQYGRDSQTCPIDTNLLDSSMYRYLW